MPDTAEDPTPGQLQRTNSLKRNAHRKHLDDHLQRPLHLIPTRSSGAAAILSSGNWDLRGSPPIFSYRRLLSGDRCLDLEACPSVISWSVFIADESSSSES